MKVKAKLNNLRISPRKVRLVIDLIRGLDVSEAKLQLNFLVKRSSKPILKLLDSAIANAKNNFKLDESNLYISEIFASEGPTLKRIMPRAMGRAFHIMKRTSHITIVLEEKVKPKSGNTKKVEDLKKEKTKDIKKKTNSKETTEEKEKTTEKKSTKKPVKDKVEKKIKESEKLEVKS
jgi:large subunit ribosomal protein L22